MSLEKKRQFVEVTYDILEKEGPEGVKIRRIAGALNCTSTVIYRYFESLDHLIALASIGFFNDYIHDFMGMGSDPLLYTDPYALNLKMWEQLSHHACKHIPIYENLLFGKYQNALGDVIFEYYQLFLDDARPRFDGFSSSILFSGDIFQRNFVLLRRAAALGTMTMAEAETLNQVECHLFHGILSKYAARCREPGIPNQASGEFMGLLRELEKKYRRTSQKG